jgi:hypothetical protein
MSTSNPVVNAACDVCIPVGISHRLNRKSAVLPSLHMNGMYTSFCASNTFRRHAAIYSCYIQELVYDIVAGLGLGE